MTAQRRPRGNEGKGRPKGSKNKATLEVREAAQKYTEQAVLALANIMVAGESEMARIAAANSLLDRGHGKPRQEVEHSGKDGAPIVLPVLNVVIGGNQPGPAPQAGNSTPNPRN